MDININEIVGAKISEMHESGEIQKRVEDGVSKSIFEAIDSAVRDYSFKREIEKKVESELSVIAKSIDFSAYTALLTSRLEGMVNEYVKGELANKINDQFKKVYLNKPEQITLTQILDAYKEWLCSQLDDQEKDDNDSFAIDVDRKYSSFLYFKCGIPRKRTYLDEYKEKQFNFSFMYDDKEAMKGHLFGATVEHINMKETMKIGDISDFEAMLISALFNETPIIIDIDAEEYDNYFDED